MTSDFWDFCGLIRNANLHTAYIPRVLRRIGSTTSEESLELNLSSRVLLL